MELSLDQIRAIEAVKNGESCFITGRAGTGKSTVVKAIIDLRLRGLAITASTGCAACGVGGSTLHSFAGLGIGTDPAHIIVRSMAQKTRQRILETSVLLIDEISMITSDLFDKLDAVFRAVRASTRPFGGMQIVVIGDFFQLPPVIKTSFMEDGPCRADSTYCFESAAWQAGIRRTIELKTVFRQKDQSFLNVLEDIRLGRLSEESIRILQSRIGAVSSPQDGIEPTNLRSRRDMVDRENMERLSRIASRGWKSTAKDTGDPKDVEKMKRDCIAPDVLYMKVGAQVLLIKNLDVDEGLCNGASGVIQSIDEHGMPTVEFHTTHGTTTLRLKPERWIFRRNRRIIATRTQIPLVLGWSITIHKSQGMTIDKVNVSISDIFSTGQCYTALSRVKTLEGLTIDRIPEPDVIRVDEKVVNFYRRIETESAAPQ